MSPAVRESLTEAGGDDNLGTYSMLHSAGLPHATPAHAEYFF